MARQSGLLGAMIGILAGSVLPPSGTVLSLPSLCDISIETVSCTTSSSPFLYELRKVPSWRLMMSSRRALHLALMALVARRHLRRTGWWSSVDRCWIASIWDRSLTRGRWLRKVSIQTVLVAVVSTNSGMCLNFRRRRQQWLGTSASSTHAVLSRRQLSCPSRNVARRFLRGRKIHVVPQTHLDVVLWSWKAVREIDSVLW